MELGKKEQSNPNCNKTRYSIFLLNADAPRLTRKIQWA